MEFDKLVIDVLSPIFKKHNLLVEDRFENYVKLKSERIELIISHNVLDKGNSLSIVNSKGFSYPMDEDILKLIFQCDLKIDNVTPEIFIKNLALFFEDKGRSLLDGGMAVLEAILQYGHKESTEYTAVLLNSQNLEAADRAWENTEYKDFIKYIDSIDILNLPDSYQLKYKIAQKKLGV